MDLLTRVIVAAVILIIVLYAVYYALRTTIFLHITKQQAEANVTADLQTAYPNAVINITNASPSSYSGSWHISASVVLNATTPCPQFFVNTYDYPQFNFVPTLENTYTNNCVINGFSPGKPFIISSFPVAITMSYRFNATKKFVNTYGFSNVYVSAHFYSSTNLIGRNFTNVWVVMYSPKSASYGLHTILTQINGTLLAAYNTSS